MGMVYINGQMVVCIKEIGIKIKFQNMANIIGMMEELIKDIGLIIICMDKVSTNGLTVENMRVNTSMIKNMVMEFIHILMAVRTKETG